MAASASSEVRASVSNTGACKHRLPPGCETSRGGKSAADRRDRSPAAADLTGCRQVVPASRCAAKSSISSGRADQLVGISMGCARRDRAHRAVDAAIVQQCQPIRIADHLFEKMLESRAPNRRSAARQARGQARRASDPESAPDCWTPARPYLEHRSTLRPRTAATL